MVDVDAHIFYVRYLVTMGNTAYFDQKTYRSRDPREKTTTFLRKFLGEVHRTDHIDDVRMVIYDVIHNTIIPVPGK